MRNALLLAALSLAACRRDAALPVLSTVPSFALTAEDGRAFRSSELAGQVWVADLIFTNCPDVCPRMSTLMYKLQTQSQGLRLVSFTVDPDRDTPAALAAYAKRHKADAQRWTFLTGAREELDKVSQAFFFGKVHVDHSSRFVLIDKQARVRGFYGTDDPEILPRLLADVERLRGE